MEATLISTRERKVDYRRGRPAREDSPYSETRVYVDFNETLLENLANRRSRPYNELKPIVAAALTKQGIRFEKLRWSRYAGCSMCPCSGGFILVNGDIGKDIWVSVA